jgi:hypothetical protein
MWSRHGCLLTRRPAHPVDPEIRRRPNQVGFRILQPRVGPSQEAEYAHQGVLDKVLPIPHVAGQLAALRMEHWPVLCQLVDVTSPRPPYRPLNPEILSRSCHRVPIYS